MSRFFVAAALMALFAGQTSAGMFRVGDLGEMPSRQACMTVAAEVLERPPYDPDNLRLRDSH